LYKSMSSSLGTSWRNSDGIGMGYSPIKFYCMNCAYEHKESACPKCGSKVVRVA
jgi:Zn finger protein HypA/HybF involved in hydrogenase expression